MEEDIVVVATLGSDGLTYSVEIVYPYTLGPYVPPPAKRKRQDGDVFYRLKGTSTALKKDANGNFEFVQDGRVITLTPQP